MSCKWLVRCYDTADNLRAEFELDSLSEAEAKMDHMEHYHGGRMELEPAEPTEPEECDIITGDYREWYEWGTGKLLLTTPTGADYRADVLAYMDDEGFFPNVWFLSDHGNPHLIDLTT